MEIKYKNIHFWSWWEIYKSVIDLEENDINLESNSQKDNYDRCLNSSIYWEK